MYKQYIFLGVPNGMEWNSNSFQMNYLHAEGKKNRLRPLLREVIVLSNSLTLIKLLKYLCIFSTRYNYIGFVVNFKD